MSYKNQDVCIKKAFDDELLFVLMARDVTAPLVVMEWIKQNIGKQPMDKLREAFECALQMASEQKEFEKRKNKCAEESTSNCVFPQCLCLQTGK